METNYDILNNDFYEKVRPLKLDSKFSTMAVTCYDEQLENIGSLISAIKSFKSTQYQIIAICHDKSATNKPHYHILVRVPDPKRKKTVSAMLKELHIKFDAKRDTNLMKNHGLETCGHFPSYSVYLLHRTTAAKQEGKTEYSEQDLITNLNDKELNIILSGYNATKRALTKRGVENLIDKARDAGLKHENLDELIASFNVLGITPTQETTIRRAYDLGVAESLRNSPEIVRFGIVISYPDNKRNTVTVIDEAIKKAASHYNYVVTNTVTPISHMDPSTECIIYTNAILQTITGNSNSDYNEFIYRLLQPHCYESPRKLSTKALPWLGHVIITTTFSKISELRHNEYCYYCKIQDNKLYCEDVPSTPYTKDDAIKLTKEYKKFRDIFNNSMKFNNKHYSINLEKIND